MSAAQLIESISEMHSDPHVHDAVLGWLDKHGSKEPTKADALKMLKSAGVKNPEMKVDAFMTDWAGTSIDADFSDEEVAPPGWEPTVKAMKKHKDIDNPWALAWYMKGKGAKSRK